MISFIPSLHFAKPADKLKPEWCKEAIDYYYHNTDNKSLLHGKDIEEIEAYATGEFDMTPYKRLYRSMQKATDNHPNQADREDKLGLQWQPLPLIPNKLNAAIATVQKIPVEISCTAMDALAAEKKEEDVTFLKNKQVVQADLQELADQMQAGEIDLGTTRHADVAYSDSPYGLDLNDPEELDVFVNLLYSHNVETAYETALQIIYEQRNANQVKLLEITDQFKFGVSAHRAFINNITRLPDIQYLHPSTVYTPHSSLPNLQDRTHTFIRDRITPMELFNYFGDEIKNMDALGEIINGDDGYCACNKMQKQSFSNFGSMKLDVIYMEVKSVDWIGIIDKPNSKRGAMEFTTDEKRATRKLWAQNTYAFWWLVGTKHFFGIERLPFAHRELGNETFQQFTINIYRSQRKGAVELAIGENKKAQVADIKMQHAIRRSAPSGKYIDLRFIRGALSSLNEEGSPHTINDLIRLAIEENQFIGDTEEFDGKTDGQYKPVERIAGGLDIRELQGYMQVIADASAKISMITGINDQLAGTSSNPEGLVGMQKLMINASLNALYYVNEAVSEQYQSCFNVWKSGVKAAVEEGGKAKEMIASMVGKKKASLIDGIDESKAHDIGVKITISQREEERARFEQGLAEAKQKGIISAADEHMLRGLRNPKDQFALLAVKEKQALKRKQQEQQALFQQQQQLLQQQGQNQQQAVQIAGDKKIEQIYAKADAESKILTLSNQLGLSDKQTEAMLRRMLQQDRTQGQIDKAIKVLETKSTLDQQKAMI